MSNEKLLEKYRQLGLSEQDLGDDPIVQLQGWLELAATEGCAQPTAMALATSDAKGMVSVRAVLCRGIAEQGLSFYTNYNSPKIVALGENPNCAVLFNWLEIERQVRVTAIAERAITEQSDDYWATRPRESQIAAMASDQSAPLESLEAFEARVSELEDEFSGQDVPRPPHWGGTVLRVESMEFWQGRGGRMHDRFVYSPIEAGWVIQRLYP